jgi:hypothetical protein
VCVAQHEFVPSAPASCVSAQGIDPDEPDVPELVDEPELATTPVWLDVAEVEPTELLAATTTRMVWPTSALPSV